METVTVPASGACSEGWVYVGKTLYMPATVLQKQLQREETPRYRSCLGYQEEEKRLLWDSPLKVEAMYGKTTTILESN